MPCASCSPGPPGPSLAACCQGSSYHVVPAITRTHPHSEEGPLPGPRDFMEPNLQHSKKAGKVCRRRPASLFFSSTTKDSERAWYLALPTTAWRCQCTLQPWGRQLHASNNTLMPGMIRGLRVQPAPLCRPRPVSWPAAPASAATSAATPRSTWPLRPPRPCLRCQRRSKGQGSRPAPSPTGRLTAVGLQPPPAVHRLL